VIPRALYALSPHALAGEMARRATASGNPAAIVAAQARINFFAGKVPQRGMSRAAWVAWHRQSGIAGFGNRTARANDLDLPVSVTIPTVVAEEE